jgi:ATP-dependent Clp protease adaptor protein ClpS
MLTRKMRHEKHEHAFSPTPLRVEWLIEAATWRGVPRSYGLWPKLDDESGLCRAMMPETEPARSRWEERRSFSGPADDVPATRHLSNPPFSTLPLPDRAKHVIFPGYRSPLRIYQPIARMIDTVVKPRTKVKPKTERPKLYKVILLNDDFTPREFVVTVLKVEFRMTEDQAHKVMITAHRLGACVVAVFTKDVAETKATRATDAGRAKGYPLLFTTEPEE